MRDRLAFSAPVLLGALLLAGCGTQQPPGAGTGPAPASAARCGFPGGSADAVVDGVEITGVGGGASGCGTASPAGLAVGFRVTNHEAETLTYTVEFEVVSAAGEALAHPTATVQGVRPGRTAVGTADVGAVMGGGTGAQVRIHRVRSVPAGEAPATSGPCPASGVRVSADRGDAAMGLRVVGLHLENCSDRPYRLDGFPQVRLLDLHHRPVAGVGVLHGSGGISTGTGFDEPPRAMTLEPGERATAGLMWRNTFTDGTPVDVPYVRVVARPGTPAVTLTPELDLGTTGKLGVGPWRKEAR